MPKLLDYKQESLLKEKIQNKYRDKFEDLDFSFNCLLSKDRTLPVYKEMLDIFKFLFAQGEEERIFLWNAIYEDAFYEKGVNEIDFSNEEIEFIKKVFSVYSIKTPRNNANKNSEISTKRLLLKPYDDALDTLYRDYYLSHPEEFETYYQREYDKGVIYGISLSEQMLHFAVIEAKSGRFIGSIGLNELVNDKKIDVEYCIFDEYQRNGFAHEAVSAIIDAIRHSKIVIEYETIRKGVFEIKPIHPLYLQLKINVNNLPSIALAEKLGATKDGILRAENILHDEILDYYLYTIKI